MMGSSTLSLVSVNTRLLVPVLLMGALGLACGPESLESSDTAGSSARNELLVAPRANTLEKAWLVAPAKDVAFMVAPDADLQLIVTQSAESVEENKPIRYTMTLTNLGPDPASANVVLNVNLPAGLTAITFSTPGGWGCSPATNPAWRCTLFVPLAPNNTQTIIFNANVPNLDDQLLMMSADVSSPTNDPIPANNSGSVEAVTGFNDAPTIAVPGQQTTVEDVPLVFSTANGNRVSTADVDAFNRLVKVTINTLVAGPARGTLTLSQTTGLNFTNNGDGIDDPALEFEGALPNINAALNGMIFKPTPDYFGNADLLVNVLDQGNSGLGTAKRGSRAILINVTPNVNDPPNAVDDAFPVPGEAVNYPLNVLANDTFLPDPPETLTITAVTQPANGSVTFTPTGVSFTPIPGFRGTTTFTYTITDPGGLSDTATVTVTVGSPNNPPTANDDSYTVSEDSAAATFTVLVNDTPLPDTNEGLTIISVTQPTGGTVTFTQGNVSFTPAPNFFGTATFTYTITDGRQGEDTATVTVTVTPVNDPPDAVNDALPVPEDTATVLMVLANDTSAPDGPETLLITAVTQPANGTVTNNGNNVTFTPAAEFNGTTSFSYTISDGNGGTDTATVTVTVTPVNDPPNANDDSFTVAEDSAATPFNVLANDTSAPETGETLTITAVTQPTGGTVTNTASNVSFTPAPNFAGTTTFTYTISDGNGGTDTATVTVTVTPSNDAPDAVNDSLSVGANSGPNVLNVLANDTDPDAGNTLTITAVTQPANGTVTNNGTNVTFTPATNFRGTTTFTYTITDGNGGTDTATVTVQVTNNPPTANDDSFTVAEDSALTPFTVLANDSTAPDTGETLSITSVTQPANGTATFSPTTVSFQPAPNFAGTTTFNYTVSDGSGGTDTATVTMTVTPVNDAPTANSDFFSVARNSGATALDVLANDSIAPDTGETLTVTAVTQPANGTVTFTPTGVSFTPAANFTGPTNFTYTISDGNGGSATATVVVNVTQVNAPPTANNDSFTVAEDSGLTTMDVLANDTTAPDAGETLTITSVTQPANGSVTFTGANVRFTPVANFNGTTTFSYTVSDGNGGTATATVTVTVTAVNDPPDAVNDVFTVNEDSAATALDVLANDTTAPDIGDTLMVTAVTQPAAGTVTLVGGVVSFTPAAGFSGTTTFNYTVSDGTATDTATVTVTVTPVNDPPTANNDSFTVAEDSAATTMNVLANDSTAPDTGETLTITSVTQPVAGTVTFTGTNVSFTPAANFAGNVTFTYTVSDGNGGTATATVTVTVSSVNDAPDAVNDSLSVAEDSTNNTLNVLANDSVAPDVGETLVVTTVTQPGAGSVVLGGGTVSYTPPPNFNGTTTFNYTVSDGNGGTDTATVTVTVTPVNDAPDAVNDAVMVAENSTGTVLNVLANDLITPDTGETLTVTAVTQPANGTVTLNAGVVTFTPTPSFTGTTSFTYTISDGNGGTDTATVTVTVSPVNDPPDAVNDTYTVAEDSSFTVFDVLANDTFAPDVGETLIITSVTQPANGTVSSTSANVRFTPAPNFNGTTSFTYTISDGNGGTDTATVTVTVTSVNDLPTATNDSFTVGEDSAVTVFNVLANDTAAPDVGETLTITDVTQPAGGTVTFTASDVSFTPAPNFNGTTSFSYRISDGNGGTATATVTVTVTAVNDPPDAVNDAVTVAEDSAATVVSVLANDTFAPDMGETLTVTAVTQPAGGTVTFTGTNVSFTPNANFNGTTSFTYTISDGNSGTDTATVTVTVTPVNDPPTANDDSFQVAEDSTGTALTVLANDSSAPDSGETLAITSVTQPANGSVAFTATGVTFTPNTDFVGTTTFTYTISDGNGGTATATVTVTVGGENDPPVANSDTFTVAEDSGATPLDVLANDSSAPDVGETLTVTAVTQPANGTVTLVGGVVSFTPAPNYFGTTTFTYTVSDGTITATATVTVNVTAVNDPPDAVDDSFSVAEGSGATAFNVLANDSTGPEPTETLTITAVTQPANGTVTSTNFNVSFTPAANFTGTTTFTYTVSDGNGGTDTATVTVTVTPVNDPPDAVSDTFTVAEDSGATELTVLANDSTAPDVGETLTVDSVTQPANGTVTLVGGVVSFTPAPNFNGTTAFTYTVSDGNGGSDTAAVTVTVTPVNDPPTASDDTFSVLEDTVGVVLNVLANDTSSPDTGETLSITAVTQPANGTVTSTATDVTFTPEADFVGTVTFEYTLSDGNGGTDTATVTVTVTPANDPPNAVDDTFMVAEDSGANVLTVLANDTFAPDLGETLTVTGVTQPAGGTVTFTAANVSFTPTANFVGTATFTYTISDGNGGSDTATVTVTVTPVNDAPVADDDSFSVAEDSSATVLDVLANDSTGPDADETLTVTAVTQPANGTVTLTGGVVRFTPVANFNGTTSFTYTVSDGNGGSDTGTVTVVVTPVNDPPTANNDTFSVAENSGATVLNVLANDTTVPDTGETLIVTSVTQPVNGTVSFTGSNVSFTPAAGFSGATTFTYTISDGNGGTATATVTVNVGSPNNPPSANDDSYVVAEDSGPNVLSVLANDTIAPDVGETLEVTAVTQPVSGTVTFSPANVTFTPAANFNGTVSFSYTVSDGNGGFDTAQVTVVVTPVNDAPNANDDSFTVLEDSGATVLNVLANDTIVPDTGETLTVTAVTQPASGTVTLTGGVVRFTPPANFSGPVTFMYTVSDGNGGTDTATVTVMVTEVNDPPVAVNDTLVVAEDSGATVVTVLANDVSGPDAGETLTVTAVSQPANGTVTLVGGVVSFTPAPNFNGTTSFTYTISDGRGGSSTASVAVTVTPVNDPPDAVDDSYTVAENSGATVLNVLINDTTAPDVGETLTVTAVTQPANGGSVTFTGSNVSFTPTAGFSGTASFTYTISDGNGGTDTATVTVTVSGDNNPPVAVDDSVTVAEDSGATVVSVLANDTDPDGDTLTITAVTQPANGSVTFTVSDVSFTPAPNFHGTTSFTYTVSDGNGLTDSATVTVTVTPVNDAPNANDDTFTVAEDSGGTVLDVLANDTFAPDTGETLTVTAVTQPANGAVTLVGGVVRFTPAANFSGTTSFTYTIADGNGGNDTATVTVVVTPVNELPNAVDDTFSVPEDRLATVLDVLANDTSAPDVGETLTVIAVTQPANGSVSLTGGVVRYTPPANFNGTTSFTYTISDGNGGTDTATVTVTVTPVNDAPNANDDSFRVAVNSVNNVLDVLVNDTAAPDVGETLTVVAVTQPAVGTVLFTATGVTFTPEPDFSGTVTFTYTISDGNGETDTATVTVMVSGTNNPPSANDDSFSVAEDSTATLLDVLANDTTEAGETLAVVSVTQPANGTVTLSGTEVRFTPAPNFNGTTTFTYTASDGNGGFDPATVTVVVTPVNDPPTANDDAFTLSGNSGPTVLNVLANDSTAPDTGETLTVTAVTQPANGTVTLVGGVVRYSPAAGFVGSETFNYTISDGNGGTDTATVTVLVFGQQGPPVANDDGFRVARNSGATVLNVLANDLDPDGDTLTVTAVTQPANGTVTLVGGVVSFTPATGFTGTTTFEYTISDGNGGTDTATVIVTVEATQNDPPVANDDSYTVAQDSGATVLTVLTNDTDPDGDTLTITAVTQPANGTVTTNGTTVSFTPAAGFNGTTTFEYTISDGNGGTDTATVTITVTPPSPNDPPVANDDSFTVAEDSGATVLTVLANDTDPNTGDVLVVTAVTQPVTGGTVTLVGGVVSFTPAANFNGTATFEYTLSDGKGGTDTATITVTVTPVNDAPVGGDDTFSVNSNGGPAELNVLANDTDVDGDALTVSAVTQPTSGGTVAITTGGTGLVFTPTAGFNGPATFTYTVDDGKGGTDVVNVTVNLGVGAVDTDGDGVNDADEVVAGTDPNDNDTDDDGVTDGTDGLVDTDGDGRINALDPDSDNDGLLDGTETGVTVATAPSGTNQSSPNFRADEDPSTTTNVRVADTDGDTLLDGEEDANHNGRVDDGETDPNKADTDDDGLPDNIELEGENPTDPLNPDTDDDGLDDGEEDANHNGRVDDGETDPNNADTDGGGATDGEEVAGGTNPLDDSDDFIIGGGGCASTGASSLMPLVLLLGLPLLRRRRGAAGSSQSSKLGAWAGLVVLALLVAVPAHAQVVTSPVSDKIDVQQYKPGPGAQDLLGLHSPKLGKHMQWNLGASINYATAPLTVIDPRTDTAVYKIVASQLTVDLMGAIALFDRLELGLALPITSQTSEDAPAGMPVYPEGSGTGLGNLRVVPKVNLLSSDTLYLGAALPIHLPTGGSQFRGGAFTVQPRLLAEWGSSGGLRLLANLGMNLRPKEQLRGLVVGNELAYGVGAEVPFGKLSAGGTLVGAMGLGQDAEERPMELLATVRYRISDAIAAHLGGGPGLGKGYGTPGFRVFAGVAWVAPEGKAQPEPQPEPKPEPKPAPPPDTDGDGMTDDKDACPNEAEDKDGFEDEDGCPDTDNDKDGVADAGDACVNEPETQNGYQDADGCPDEVPDTDGDGIKDDKDRCAKEPEDKDGFQDEDGCPDPDNDRDGVADAADKCPAEPEVINGVKDEDGCPDKGKVKVLVEGEKIVILEKVFFANNKAAILPKSFPLLKQVAQVMRANPQIELVRVEGHTDDKGDDGANLTLSKSRAESVRARLIQEGIAAERLEAVGYGEAKPVDSNKTARGREKNRRVEFIVTKVKSKEVEVEQP